MMISLNKSIRYGNARYILINIIPGKKSWHPGNWLPAAGGHGRLLNFTRYDICTYTIYMYKDIIFKYPDTIEFYQKQTIEEVGSRIYTHT